MNNFGTKQRNQVFIRTHYIFPMVQGIENIFFRRMNTAHYFHNDINFRIIDDIRKGICQLNFLQQRIILVFLDISNQYPGNLYFYSDLLLNQLSVSFDGFCNSASYSAKTEKCDIYLLVHNTPSS